MVVIPNPVTLSPTPPTERRKKRRHVVLAAGNLRKEKRHALLVEAFARIAGAYPQWDLHIAGDGPELPALEEQIRAIDLRDRVKLLGPVHEMAHTYANADIFVVPSEYESFGIATAEALAAGIPAVGFSDCPGTNRIIVDEVNGLLVGGSDPVPALAGALVRLMRSPEQRSRLGAAGPATVAQYSLNSIVEQWERLLSKVARRPAAQRAATRGVPTTSA
jgi:glycosyltransferase involved in cell wall biosynthesis